MRVGVGVAILALALALALAVAGALGSGARAVMSDDPPIVAKDPRYLEAERAVKAQDYRRAIQLLVPVAERNPADPDTHSLLGFSHRKLGDFDRAMIHYRRALELDPDHLGANEYQGELYLELKDLAKAEERLQRLARIAACRGACEEFRDLKRAIDRYKAAAPRG